MRVVDDLDGGPGSGAATTFLDQVGSKRIPAENQEVLFSRLDVELD